MEKRVTIIGQTIKHENNISVFGVLSAVVVTLVMADRTMATEQPPNILFIMADDHTTQAIGAYGGRLAPLNPTPISMRWRLTGCALIGYTATIPSVRRVAPLSSQDNIRKPMVYSIFAVPYRQKDSFSLLNSKRQGIKRP